MLKTLVKVQFLSLLSSFLNRKASSSSQKSGKSKTFQVVIISILMLYLIGMFFFMMLGYNISVCKALVENGYTWFYFSLPFVLGCGVSVFYGMFSAKNQLFEAKDNEMLLAMPIEPKNILISRLIIMAAPDILIDTAMLGVAGIVYIFFYGIEPVGAVIFVLLALVTPLFSMAISCLFGWLLSVVSSWFKNKQLISTMLSVTFIIVYLYFYFSFIGFMSDKEITTADLIMSKLIPMIEGIEQYLPIVKCIGLSVSEPNILYAALIITVSVASFVIAMTVISKQFIKIVTTKRGGAKNVYRAKEVKANSQSKALFIRDLKRLGGSSIYLINSCIGALMLVAAPIVIGFSGVDALLLNDELGAFIPLFPTIAIFGMCLLSSMITVTASSVSLEGKYIWIIKSLPVKTEDILLSKVKVHLTVALPASLITSVLLMPTIRPNIVNGIFMVVTPLVFNICCALFGLVANLRFPNLSWINEAQPVKQSMSTFIAMFVPPAVLLVFGAVTVLPDMVAENLGLQFGGKGVGLAAFTLMIALVSFVLYKILIKWGVRKFNSL